MELHINWLEVCVLFNLYLLYLYLKPVRFQLIIRVMRLKGGDQVYKNILGLTCVVLDIFGVS